MESKNFGVQVEDVSFIINAITNMYSDIMGSIVREIASNCRDAAPDKTFIVGVDEREVYFRDFGTGMSREFMLNDYLSVGKSSKRNEASSLGSFGFGRISVLAYVDSYFVTTCHGGHKTKYLVTKDGLAPSITVLETEETDEVGTLVGFLFASRDRLAWHSAIMKHTAYFQNCELHLGVVVKTKHQTFEHDGAVLKQNQYVEGFHFVVGECLYPIDKKQLDLNGRNSLSGCNVGLYIPIEEGFRPTPSRESMVYTEEFKKYVVEKLSILNNHFEQLLLAETRQFKIIEYISTEKFKPDIEIALTYRIQKDTREILLEKKKIDWSYSPSPSFFYQRITKGNWSVDKFVVCPQTIPRGFGFIKTDREHIFVKREPADKFPLKQLGGMVLDDKSNPTDVKVEDELKRRQAILDEYFEELEREPNYIKWDDYVASLNMSKSKVVSTKKEGINYLRVAMTKSNNYVVDKHDFTYDALMKNWHHVCVGTADQTKFDILECFSHLSKKNSVWLLPNKTQLNELRTVLTHKIFDMSELTTTKNPILTRVYHQIKIDEAVELTGIRSCTSYQVHSLVRKIDPDFCEVLMAQPFKITQEAREAVIEAALTLDIPDPVILPELEARRNIFHLLLYAKPSGYGSDKLSDLFIDQFEFYFHAKLASNRKETRLSKIINSPTNDPVEELELCFDD